ncbi:MAG: hypothetical protein ACYTKD_27940 [Planctomycetota bacterium]|jgi:hypothetical protein
MASEATSAASTTSTTRNAAAAVVVAGLVALASCNGKPRNGGGNGGDGNGGITFNDPERIVLGIESGEVGKPFEVADDAECSGGKCVLLAETWEDHHELNPRFRTEGGKLVSKEDVDKNPAGEKLLPNGTIEVPFTVKKAGTYDLWVRAWFHCGCANSFFLSVDSPPPVDTDGDGKWDENVPYIFNHQTFKRWKWIKNRGARFELDEGPHVIRIFNREDGIKLDQVFMPELVGGAIEPYTPQGIEKPTP